MTAQPRMIHSVGIGSAAAAVQTNMFCHVLKFHHVVKLDSSTNWVVDLWLIIWNDSECSKVSIKIKALCTPE